MNVNQDVLYEKKSVIISLLQKKNLAFVLAVDQ